MCATPQFEAKTGQKNGVKAEPDPVAHSYYPGYMCTKFVLDFGTGLNDQADTWSENVAFVLMRTWSMELT